jgi:hypothetical protein
MALKVPATGSQRSGANLHYTTVTETHEQASDFHGSRAIKLFASNVSIR